jgi:transcriptional regulator with XRE-family HTH domain
MERYTIDENKIGTQLKSASHKKKITQSKLAEMTGLSVNFVARVWSGYNKPSLHSLVQMCNALDIPVEPLLSMGGDSSSKENKLLELFSMLDDQAKDSLLYIVESMSVQKGA